MVCDFCTAELVLEANDEVTEVIEKTLSGGTFVRVKCPTCTQILTHEKPDLRRDHSWKTTTSQKYLVTELGKSKIPYSIKPELDRKTDDKIDKLIVPTSKDFRYRTYEPGIESLVRVDQSAQPILEEQWGNTDLKKRVIPWKWCLCVGFILLSIIGWSQFGHSFIAESKSPPQPISKPPSIQETAHQAVISEWEKRQEASALIEQVTATVRSYFSATRIEELALYVRQPERVRPLMEKFYENQPIVVNPIGKKAPIFNPLPSPPGKDFWMGVCELADQSFINVVVEISATDEPKIDWETVVNHQPMNWDDFAKQRPEEVSVDFRVYIQDDDYFTDEFADSKVWRCLMLSERDGDAVVYGYVKSGSSLANEIFKRIDADGGEKSTAILRLRIPANLKSKRGVLIEKLVSPLWIYIEPPKP